MEKLNLDFEDKRYPMTPLKPRPFLGDLYGFDVETANKNKDFVLAVITHKDKSWTFNDREELAEFFTTKRFRGSRIIATNLQFDFNQTFFGLPQAQDYALTWRGSDLIKAVKSYKRQSVTFLDTMNYAPFSVKRWGEILNTPKFNPPSFLGSHPKTLKDYKQLEDYCRQDSRVSEKTAEFLYESFTDLGGSPKNTIAGTSINLFRSKFLKKTYFRHEIPTLLEQYKAYYGGRVEAIRRGRVRNHTVYDINSLYPSIMRDEEFPDPNRVRVTNYPRMDYINSFEGVSYCHITAPEMFRPYLPLRHDNKLIFPYGSFKAWYTHLELRKAMSIGYEVKPIKTHYYPLKNITPFKEFVDFLYSKRLEFQKNNDPMEIVVKLLLNSLYGKFGQKFTDRVEYQPESWLTTEKLKSISFLERIGDYLRIKKDISRPAVFTFPIWSAYVTAHARTRLWDLATKYDACYYDTDSIMTKKSPPTSTELGALKVEYNVKDGVIVRPKMYLIDDGEVTKVKAKGVSRISNEMFASVLVGETLEYPRFSKFREALRRNLTPNEIINQVKHLNLEDSKRLWKDPFNADEWQESQPLFIS